MARTKISEFSATAADNTDIDNIDIAEGCAPSGINNAIRELMAQLKEMQTGASGDTFTLTTVNSTTIDTTNLEVSNIKAKDGTAAGSIADSTGVVTLTSLTGATADYTNLEVTNIKAKDGTAAATIADSTGVMTVNTLSTGGGNISPQTGFKNRIINGDMRIDQRNAGASVTPTDAQYTLDRWNAGLTQASKFSVQQSSVAPAGFINSLLVTSLSAYSVAAGDLFRISQYIEGFNAADLGWGTANAQSITFSFWVRSSLTGTFGGALLNGAGNRSYPFSYTISTADTFEYKTVTIAGDTSGTWLTTNGIGIRVGFNLGAGATLSGTSGAWAAATLTAPTGATSVVGTNGATFYITGVQLEKGSTATPFEFRSYGQELALCQRYLPAFMSAGIIGAGGTVRTATIAAVSVPFPVQTRVAPTGITTNTSTGVNYAAIAAGGGDFTNMAITFSSASNMNSNLLFTNGAATMTVGHGIQASLNSVGYVYFNGCEL